MKNSGKLILVIALLVLVLAGWMLSIEAASGTEELEQQQELIEQAREYVGKELYVRAIPKYEEALTYSTEYNTEYEKELLEVYEAYGDADSYLELALARIGDNTAQEDEYLRAAEIYLNSSDLEEAMEILLTGMERYDSQELLDFYEANRYACSIRVTEYEEIIPTSTNSTMLAYDGESWYYISSKGKKVWSTGYEEAYSMNSSGYAVVKLDGTYYTIISGGDLYGVDEIGVEEIKGLTGSLILAKVDGKYSYYSYDYVCVGSSFQLDDITINACGVAAIELDGSWAIITDSGQTVVDYGIEDVAVNSLGSVFASDVGMVKIDGKWCLIDSEGNTIVETDYADVKAPESSEYIAVCNEDGDWGFMDHTGELVIECQYKDALSFSDGLAAVLTASGWEYISQYNVVVLDNGFEDAEPFHNGIAQAKMVSGEALITLEYVEE